MTAAGKPRPPYLRLSLVLVLVMAGLFTLDRLLARLQASAIEKEASTQYETGQRELLAGRKTTALLALESAHATDRGRRDIALALSEALAANGRRQEAEAQLQELLNADSNDGRANLLLARLLASEKKESSAIAYYHRAIYGTWQGNTGDEAFHARMELARYLGQLNRHQELLSELLLLQQPAMENASSEEEMASLFLAAQSGARAQQIYRDMIHRNRAGWEAYRGMGEADLLEGDFRGAESMFQSALRRHPGDAALAARADVAQHLVALDPTPRDLTSRAKYERAISLLDALHAEAAGCGPAPPPASPAIAPKQNGTVTNEQAESRLRQAEELWNTIPRACQDAPAGAVNEMVMKKLQRVR